MSQAEVLLPLGLGLGEGPTALQGRGSDFLVVDIHEGNVHHCSLSGTSRIRASREKSIGAVALLEAQWLTLPVPVPEACGHSPMEPL